MGNRLGGTMLMRENNCWCSSCKQSVNNTKGRYIKLAGGLRQKWVCNECLKRAGLSLEEHQ